MDKNNDTTLKSGSTQDANDPVEQMLNIQPPVDKKEGKKIPKYAKIGAGAMGFGMIFLVALQMLQPAAPGSQQVAGTIGVRVAEPAGFVPTPATVVAVNPEAAALAARVDEQRAQEILDRPGASFVTADPFGNPIRGTVALPPENGGDQTNPLMPPPPPPVFVSPQPIQQAPPGQQVEDPATIFARTVFSSATTIRTPGVSPGNYTPAADGALNVGGGPTGEGGVSTTQTRVATMGAGEIVYAQLTSLLNSIVPQTPPRAIIRGGPLNGAILLGQMEVVENRYLVLRFTTLTLNRKTYPISAMAVNTEMLDAGLVDRVNNRVWTRAALQAGVGFVQSFGAATLDAGTTRSVDERGEVTTSAPVRTSRDNAIIALGGAAQSLQPTVEQQINNIKDEVIALPGKEMGIIFMQPFFME